MKRTNACVRLLATSLAATLAAGAARATPAEDALLRGFRDPPAEARPRAWWHWLNGNITQDGITKDLEWMKAVGLGGVQTFDASLGTPQVVRERLAFMTPKWKAAFAHAARTADRLGLELAIASSPGWSETGGPWVSPVDGMKKLVWSETEVAGGAPMPRVLAAPPAVTGPFGAVAVSDPLASFEGRAPAREPVSSGDVAVFAYRVGETPLPAPRATTGDGVPLDAKALTDAGEDTAVTLASTGKTGAGAIVLDYGAPQMLRSVTVFVQGGAPPFGDPPWLPTFEVETAQGWRRIASLPSTNVPTTVAFAPLKARRVRLVIAPNTMPPSVGLAAPAPGALAGAMFPSSGGAAAVTVGVFRPSSETKIDRFEAKAGFSTVPDFYALSSTAPDDGGLDPMRVVDLTARTRADGAVDWTPPPGRWRLVRLGWSLIGATNHPASVEATGLEVDKYDGAAVRRYLEHHLDNYGPTIGGAGVKALVTDSIESGDANWTPRMLERFRALRGYDARPWLPALTGMVVASRSRSDAFLYDWRRTLAELLAREHYGVIADVAHARGLTVYGEALENGRPQLGDDIAMRAHADVPMAAMWAFGRGASPRPTLVGDILGAASVAHVYGRTRVAAESFTSSFSPWAFAPADLRHVADLEFALGVNLPVIHTSVHSPMEDREPGLSLAIFGQYFNRHETWAGMARPWVDYLARSSFLLQQGRHVADVAYAFGEEAPLTALYAKAPLVDTPFDRGFDFVDADVLAGQLSVQDGQLVSSGGARYRVLYLGGSSSRMTLTTLRRIGALVDAGAVVVGDPPTRSPSLQDDPAEFAVEARRLWRGDGARPGGGRVIAGHDLAAAFERLGLAPDFAAEGTRAGEVMFQHRALRDGDLYFVSNRTLRPLNFDGRFRVSGRAPEIWRADTGEIRPAAFRADGATTVAPLKLAPEESVFVVFRHSTTLRTRHIATPVVQTILEAHGPWRVAFQPGRGAPDSVTLAGLGSLSRQPQTGVRYFSGVATYTARFVLPRRMKNRRGLLLDLGTVGDVAEVRVNGRLVGTAWRAPYRVQIGDAVHAGVNALEVRVADLWVNRLVGDAQPGATKIAFTTAPTYRSDAPLRPSGLIGPVRVLSQTRGR